MRPRWFCLAALPLLAAGCGSSGDQPVSKDDLAVIELGDAGEVYRLYTLEKGRPPGKTADLSPLDRVSPAGVQAIQSGRVVVRFGAKLPDTGETPGTGPGDEVLAYEKQVPESGGRVLMLNRTVKAMTAEEFKAAKLAGNGSSEAPPAKPPKR